MAACARGLRARARALACLSALAVGGCRGFHADEEAAGTTSRVDESCRVVLNAGEVAALGLQSASAAAGTITASRTRFGKVVAQPGDDVQVVAPLQARLVSVQASVGQQVEAGALLATLEPSVDAIGRANLTARLAEMRAQLTGGRARLRAAEVELARLSRLVESGLATPSQQASAEAEVISKRALVAGLERSDRSLRGYVGAQITLTSPSPGVVAQAETSVGKLLSQGDLVARLVRPGARWVDVAVPPDDPTGTGYRVRVCGRAVPARLVARGYTARDGMRSDRIEVEAARSSCLQPGRTVAVAVQSEISGVVVPLAAVLRRGTGRIAFVEDHHGLYVPRVVQVAGDDGRRAAVADGISAGERVVVQGAAELLGELGFSGAACPRSSATPARPPEDGAGE